MKHEEREEIIFVFGKRRKERGQNMECLRTTKRGKERLEGRDGRLEIAKEEGGEEEEQERRRERMMSDSV